MSRPLRIEFPGAYYHLMNRGLARQEIFTDRFDRKNLSADRLETRTDPLNQVERMLTISTATSPASPIGKTRQLNTATTRFRGGSSRSLPMEAK